MANDKFEQILLLSRENELQRINRQLTELIPDEFIINDDIQKKLESHSFEFPDAGITHTDKRILVRKQDYFSAKIHLYEEALYFHRHDFVEMIYVHKGECIQFLNSFSQSVTLKAGELFVLNQNVIHGLLQKDKNAIVIKLIIPLQWIPHDRLHTLKPGEIFFDFIRNAKTEQMENYQYMHFKEINEQQAALIKQMVIEYYEKAQNYEEIILNLLFTEMFLLERHDNLIENRCYKLAHNVIDQGKIIQYIYEHSQDVTLKKLAADFGFNESYMSRIIKECCGQKFQDILKECRIEKAINYLTDTKYTVEQIAQCVGYKNTAPIYQAIREQFCMTPIEYRKSYVYNVK